MAPRCDLFESSFCHAPGIESKISFGISFVDFRSPDCYGLGYEPGSEPSYGLLRRE